MTTNASGGTLVWVGDPTTAETEEAYKYCLNHAPQIAIRRDLDHFVNFPAQNVDRVLVVRNDRMAPANWPQIIDEVAPQIPRAMMLGSSCEGESRTGNPWPNFEHFYWHQWNQVIPTWFPRTQSAAKRMSILLVTKDPPSIEGLRDLLLDDGNTVVVQRQISQPHAFNFDLVVLDDTAAPVASSVIWNHRLSDLRSMTRSGPTIRFIWLSSFPRISDWTAALKSGITSMFSKPYNPVRIAEYIRDLALSVDCPTVPKKNLKTKAARQSQFRE